MEGDCVRCVCVVNYCLLSLAPDLVEVVSKDNKPKVKLVIQTKHFQEGLLPAGFL